jgi:DNA-binding response OmpR family regulator
MPGGRFAMATEHASGNGRVVVIESDDLIRGLLSRWLTDAGYDVALDGPSSRNVVLVVADVANPGRADSLFKDLSARYGAPILVISGRFRRDLAASDAVPRRLGVRKVLAKPFSCDELLAAVEEALAGD